MMPYVIGTNMTGLAATVASLFLLTAPSASAGEAGASTAAGAPRTAPAGGPKQMRITRAGTQPSQKGPADWFTGTVRIDPLFQAETPGRVGRARDVRAVLSH